MRRTHLRGHANILKRLLIHGGGFNLGLVMRQCLGIGKPRCLQGRLEAVLAVVIALWAPIGAPGVGRDRRSADQSRLPTSSHRFELLPVAV
jgi:hypothetical protein